MARMKYGPYGPIIGKLGNTIGYIRLGQPVLRMVSHKSNKPRSEAQIAASDRMRVLMQFISPVNSFTNAGFRLKASGTNKTAQNMAVSYNISNALQGEYPGLSLDYSKILVSEGKLEGPQDPAVEYLGNALKFTWDTDVNWSTSTKRDQVMMLAFFPDRKYATYSLSGARRSAGEDLLEIDVFTGLKPGNSPKDTCIEVYMAFISDDREAISNSVYLGRVDLP